MPWCEQVNCVIYVLNIIIGALIDVSISTAGREIARQTVHFRKNAADSVLCTPTNDECKLPNWKCVLRKCTVCRAISLPGVEMDASIRSPMIMFNTYMTQFTCSHHGILICEKITTYLDANVKSKRTCFLCEELIKIKTPDFTRGKLDERVKLFFHATQDWWFSQWVLY